MELTRGAPGLLDAILDSLSDYAVIVLDHLGVICIWNVGAQRMFQFTEAEMVGKSIDALYTSQDLIVAAPQQERDGAGKAGRILDLQCLRRKDCSTLWTEGTLTPIHGPGGDLLGYLKIIRDATNRKRDRDEMQQLARAPSSDDGDGRETRQIGGGANARLGPLQEYQRPVGPRCG